MPLSPGDEAPDFTLLDAGGAEASLGDFRGRKVLVYFYPKADTPGCTKQACGLRDALPELGDAAVVGISPDKPAALARFDTKYGLGFPLLSDPDHAVAEAYGVWGEKKNYGRTYMGIVRSAASPAGRSPVARPITRGTRAVIGATTPMAQLARPW
jgi:thioredoxin-dependent peroxiredoxin